jgi:prepilin-type N-terminal cleavage/methylation domain-containing protein
VKRGSGGFSLIEVLLAMVILGLSVLAVGPLFVYGTRKTASSGDLGRVGAAAVKEMELLRRASFNSLTAGGSLTSNVTSFSDTTDPAVILRWTISDNATPATVKTINVVAIAKRTVSGPAKTVQLSTMRSR